MPFTTYSLSELRLTLSQCITINFAHELRITVTFYTLFESKKFFFFIKVLVH